MSHILEELLHGVLHFDSKAWRTLPLLVFRPGRLTRDYIDGKRARYIAPLAIFLFSVFLMYFAFALVGGPALGVNDAAVDEVAIADARKDLAAEREKLEKARAALGTSQNPEAIAAKERELERSEAAIAMGEKAIKARQENREFSWLDELAQSAREDPDFVDIDNAPKLETRINRALQNPELFLYKMQQVAYKLSFLLVPLSLPLVWFLFIFKRGVRLYDHTVFILYSLSFMTLLFVALAIGSKVGLSSGLVASLAIFVPPVHMYAQVKGAYRLGRFGALWRTFALSIMAIVTLTMFFLIVLALGVLD